MDGESLYRQYLWGEKTAFDGIVELYRENLIFSTKAAEEKIPSTSDTILPAVLGLYNPTLSDVIL